MKRALVRPLNLFFLLAPLGPVAAWAVRDELPMSVQPTSGGDVSAIPASGAVSRSGQSALLVRIHNSCFGTNLRSVANPLSDKSIITAKLTIAFENQSFPLEVSYPSRVVTPTGVVRGDGDVADNARALLKTQMESGGPALALQPTAYKIPNNGTVGIYGNVVQINLPLDSTVTVNPDGSVSVSLQGRPSLKSKSFEQQGAGGGEFMGHNGPLTASIDGLSVAADNSAIDLSVSFPGQEGFCGGYHSPLMLFFSDERPLFSATTTFPLSPTGLTKWPEANSPGYFLVLDRDRNGKIDRREELFGDQSKPGSNGFEELAKFDKNKDGFIDAKDPVFRKLRLWRDKNGDGVSQRSERVTLSSMKIEKISLKYNPDNVRSIGENAEERQSSYFTYRKNGKSVKGDIVDVWLSPVINQKMAVGEK